MAAITEARLALLEFLVDNHCVPTQEDAEDLLAEIRRCWQSADRLLAYTDDDAGTLFIARGGTGDLIIGHVGKDRYIDIARIKAIFDRINSIAGTDLAHQLIEARDRVAVLSAARDIAVGRVMEAKEKIADLQQQLSSLQDDYNTAARTLNELLDRIEPIEKKEVS